MIACRNSPKAEPNKGIKYDHAIPDSALSGADTMRQADRNYLTITTQLGLEKLSSADTSEQYRLWIEDGTAEKNVLILLKREEGQWIAYKYLFKANHNENFEVTTTEYSFEKAQPKSENLLFESKIKELRSYAFRDASEIKDYNGCMGVYGLVFEVQRKGNYKKCLYPCWATAVGVRDVEILHSLFLLFKEEFGFSFPKIVMKQMTL